MATKPITQPDLVLARIDMARAALAEAKTLQDAKRIADIAEAARVYAKRVRAGTEAAISRISSAEKDCNEKW